MGKSSGRGDRPHLARLDLWARHRGLDRGHRDADWVPGLEQQFADRRRPQDRILSGLWTDESLLAGEVFDVVLADFLLGGIDRITPYFQSRLFKRLRPHLRGRLYVVGLEPHQAQDAAGHLVLDIERLRDAALLLSRSRFHREYPRWWVVETLESSGYKVEASRSFPLVYRQRFVVEELDVCRSAIAKIPDAGLARELSRVEVFLRSRALDAVGSQGLYVVVARG